MTKEIEGGGSQAAEIVQELPSETKRRRVRLVSRRFAFELDSETKKTGAPRQNSIISKIVGWIRGLAAVF